MPNYELWYSESNCSYTMFPADHDSAAHGVEPDAVLEKVFEAPDWNDAMRQKHEHLGWEPYVPLD